MWRVQWQTVKWRGKGLRSDRRRPYLLAETGFQRGGCGASSLPWLVMPCSPPDPASETEPCRWCLKGARHCPQWNHFFKSEGPRPEPEGNGCGTGRRGASLGVFLLLEDVSAKPSSCLRSSCSVLAWFFSPLLTLLQKHIFSGKFGAADFLLSHLNSYFRSSYSFCFHALAVCVISLGIDEGKSKRRCQAEEAGSKKNPNEVCATPWEYPAAPVVVGWGSFPALCERSVCWWERTCCSHLRTGTGFAVRGCVYSRRKRELAWSAQRFKLTYSCSEVVSQMTCLENKNKGLQAHL